MRWIPADFGRDDFQATRRDDLSKFSDVYKAETKHKSLNGYPDYFGTPYDPETPSETDSNMVKDAQKAKSEFGKKLRHEFAIFPQPHEEGDDEQGQFWQAQRALTNYSTEFYISSSSF